MSAHLVRLALAIGLALATALPAQAAVINDGSLTMQWDATKGVAGTDYEFRLQHFASGGKWVPLCNAPSLLGTIICPITPPLLINGGDNFLCVDARGVRGTERGAWLSATAAGPVCNQFEAEEPKNPAPPSVEERLTALEERDKTLLLLINDLADRPDRTDDTVLRQILRDVLANECQKSCTGAGLLKAIVKRLP